MVKVVGRGGKDRDRDRDRGRGRGSVKGANRVVGRAANKEADRAVRKARHKVKDRVGEAGGKGRGMAEVGRVGVGVEVNKVCRWHRLQTSCSIRRCRSIMRRV